MKKPVQLTFLGDSNQKDRFGGKTNGKRKGRRPVAIKRPMHVTIRSDKARGRLSLLAPGNALRVKKLVSATSQRHRVKVYEWVNVGNHLHLLIQAQTREGFANFLRRLTCEIALTVTGARKGRRFGKFWNELAYSRVVQWGRAFETVKRYLELNRLEAVGVSKRLGRRLLEGAPVHGFG